VANRIHSTALLEPGVEVGDGNIIEEHAIIRSGVRIGDGNRIGPFSLIEHRVELGDGNTLHGYASIGTPGEMGSKGDQIAETGAVSIGNENVIREFVTVNFPVRRTLTAIGNNCYLMARTHIPHDARLGDSVVMATNSLIGGGCSLENHVYVGLNAHVHQWVVIGEGAMLGMSSATVKSVPPFCTVAGVPSRFLKINREGLRRRGIPDEEIDRLEAYVLGSGGDATDRLIKIYANFIQENERCLEPA